MDDLRRQPKWSPQGWLELENADKQLCSRCCLRSLCGYTSWSPERLRGLDKGGGVNGNPSTNPLLPPLLFQPSVPHVSACHFFLQMSHRPDHRAPPEREEIPFKTDFSPSMGLMPVITSALGMEAVVQDRVHCDFKS